MISGLFVIKLFATIQRACVLHSEAFFIKVSNEVFDCHCLARFFAPISSTALDLEVFIDIEK